jgi:hypothetical protein
MSVPLHSGTGKSILLKQMIKSLREKWPPSEYEGAVAVTASTGIAGYNIGGHTLHSFGPSQPWLSSTRVHSLALADR